MPMPMPMGKPQGSGLSRDAKIEAALAALQDLQAMLSDLTVSKARAMKEPAKPGEQPDEAAAPTEGEEEETCPTCGMPMSQCECKE